MSIVFLSASRTSNTREDCCRKNTLGQRRRSRSEKEEENQREKSLLEKKNLNSAKKQIGQQVAGQLTQTTQVHERSFLLFGTCPLLFVRLQLCAFFKLVELTINE